MDAPRHVSFNTASVPRANKEDVRWLTEACRAETRKSQRAQNTVMRVVEYANHVAASIDSNLRNLDYYVRQWDVLWQQAIMYTIGSLVLSVVRFHEEATFIRVLTIIPILLVVYLIQGRSAGLWRRMLCKTLLGTATLFAALVFILQIYTIATTAYLPVVDTLLFIFVLAEFVMCIQLLITAVRIEKWHFLVGLYVTDGSKMPDYDVVSLTQSVLSEFAQRLAEDDVDNADDLDKTTNSFGDRSLT